MFLITGCSENTPEQSADVPLPSLGQNVNIQRKGATVTKIEDTKGLILVYEDLNDKPKSKYFKPIAVEESVYKDLKDAKGWLFAHGKEVTPVVLSLHLH